MLTTWKLIRKAGCETYIHASNIKHFRQTHKTWCPTAYICGPTDLLELTTVKHVLKETWT